jgi:hypothetical protein
VDQESCLKQAFTVSSSYTIIATTLKPIQNGEQEQGDLRQEELLREFHLRPGNELVRAEIFSARK